MLDSKTYDVAVVGAASAGSYFARKMAEHGLKVLLIDKLSEDTIGSKYDIFHVPAECFDQYGLPKPEEGVDYSFRFDETVANSPSQKYSRVSPNRVVGMHMHPYMKRLNNWAKDAGVQIEYDAAFRGLRFDDHGEVCGLVYEKNGRNVEVSCNLVADASGIPSVARRCLPDGCVVENAPVGPLGVQYVYLRYVTFNEPQPGRVLSQNWRHYGVWEAPGGNPAGCLFGSSGFLSYDNAKASARRFDAAVTVPAFTLEKEEMNITPFRRPIYSMVCTGFVALGDAAYVNRNNGEGVIFALPLSDIAAETAAPYLKAGKRPTTLELWPVNKKYNEFQGAAYAAHKILKLGGARWELEENEYIWHNDPFRINRQLDIDALDCSVRPSPEAQKEILADLEDLIAKGILPREKVEKHLACIDASNDAFDHYMAFPEDPEDFAQWCCRAEQLWSVTPIAGKW